MSTWQTVPLASACMFDRGLTYSKGDEIDSGGTPVLRANNIDLATGRLDLSDVRYISDSVAVPNSKRTREGSLLICTASGSKSHLGKVAYIDDAIGWAFGGFMGQITTKPFLDSRYLYYLLISDIFRKHLAKRSDGVNINNLKFSDISDFAIPLPSLPEQKRIVAILDDAFEGIANVTANAERNVANAREIFEARREGVFERSGKGWLEGALGEFVTIKHGFAFKSGYFTDSRGHVLLTPGNFFERGGYRDRGAKQKYYVGPIPPGFILASGSLLVAMTEQAPGLLGSPMIVPEGAKFLHNQRLGLVEPRPNTPWVPELFEHLFNTRRFRNQVHKDGTGVKVRHTSPEKLRSVIVRIPATALEQKLVSDALTEIEMTCGELESVLRRRIQLGVELRSTLLQRAFSGQLTGKEAIAA